MSTEPQLPENDGNAEPVRQTEPKRWEQRNAIKQGKFDEPKLGIGFGLLIGLAILLFSGIGCAIFQSAVPFVMGALFAFLLLFHPRFRMVFVGYAIIVLLVILALIAICGNMKIN